MDKGNPISPFKLGHCEIIGPRSAQSVFNGAAWRRMSHFRCPNCPTVLAKALRRLDFVLGHWDLGQFGGVPIVVPASLSHHSNGHRRSSASQAHSMLHMVNE
jgi:hypothetical protein